MCTVDLPAWSSGGRTLNSFAKCSLYCLVSDLSLGLNLIEGVFPSKLEMFDCWLKLLRIERIKLVSIVFESFTSCINILQVRNWHLSRHLCRHESDVGPN